MTSSRQKYIRNVADQELAEELRPPRLRERPMSTSTRLDLFLLSLLLLAAAGGLFALISVVLYAFMRVVFR